jgi:5-methylcytosine-specific restriction endonuclease McrBC GTP-binding regulatory subunit McrB
MSKLSLQVGAKDFDIKLDEGFYEFFLEDFRKNFDDRRAIEVKELLNAYVQKSYDEYKNKQEIKQLFDIIDKI